jgi:hypothetical protein
MLRMLKNRVLRKITGPKRKEITRQLHRISLSGASRFSFLNKYDLGDGINKNTLSGACSMLGWKCEIHTMFWERKREGKRTLGRIRQRKEYRTTLGQDRGK